MKKNLLPVIMLLISLSGFGVFYIFPFFASVIYALTDNPISMKYVGIKNFLDLFKNPYFIRGLKNTAVFMSLSIPANILMSLALGMGICHLTKYADIIGLVFMAPLVIPSAATAFFWENIFGASGVLNKYLDAPGRESWFDGRYGLLIMAFIFVWKTVGYNMALFIGGRNAIPDEYYESASVEGAGVLWKFRKITLAYLTPVLFFSLIMTFVNSFKIFKEIFLITGEYPNENLYMLQHYMNNMFLSLNYSKLVSAAYILTFIILIFVGAVFKLENRISRNLIYD